MYGSWVCLAMIVAILFIHFRRAQPGATALAFAPVAVLVFTLRQYENLLWGFQITLTLARCSSWHRWRCSAPAG